MTETEFSHLFPEELLALSLHRACQDASKFWSLPIIRSVVNSEVPEKFSDLYPPSTKASMLCFQKPIDREEAERFGVSPMDYGRSFWWLRPDFLIKNGNDSLIILEAKSGDKPERIYSVPAEWPYYEFLWRCSKVSKRGFYYIVPRAHVSFCKVCLGEYFREEPSQHAGFICWEDLLSVIGDDLVRTVSEQISREADGLRSLLDSWRKAYEQVSTP